MLRVAVLYGFVESLSESAVTTLMSDVQAGDVVCQVNNVQRRYPTHCDDVAIVIRQLIDKRAQVCFLFAEFTDQRPDLKLKLKLKNTFLERHKH